MVIYANQSQSPMQFHVYCYKGRAYIAAPGMSPLEEIVIPQGRPVEIEIGAHNNAATVRIIRMPCNG